MNISKQAIEAGAKACWENDKESKWDALGESGKQAVISDFAAGLAAAIPHLRGEGKRAEASTPPVDPAIIKEASAFASAWIPDAHKSVTMPCRPNPLLPNQPVSQEPNPDDVERVARAMFDRAAWKCGWKVGWDGQTEETRDSYRDAATAAIRATNGQLWGIWNDTHKCWYSGNFNSSDKNAVEMLCASIRLNGHTGPRGQAVVFEVRPYTAPREESAEEIAANIARVVASVVSNRTLVDITESIAQAIREAEKRGTAKCG